MQPSGVDATNSGNIFIGYGQQPVGTVAHVSQGEVLVQSAYIDQPPGGATLAERYKQAIWAVSSVESQSLIVTEEVQDDD